MRCDIPGFLWRKLQAFLQHPRLGLRLALLAVLLSASALFIGFYLDDQVARYIYSEREGAARLFRNHSGGFGFALGEPAENHWLMEQGWAPWWLDEHMRFAGYRPISVLLHRVDFGALFDSPVLIHAHSLLWLALMVLAVTRMYRALLPPPVGGAAALLFALDHTHGFAAGYIMNRHALLATLLAAGIMLSHVSCRRLARVLLGPALYVLGLFTSELVVCAAAYVAAYELFAHEDTWRKRVLAVFPYVAITLLWAAWYKAAGFGAMGTDFYLDPGREPLQYLRAFCVRTPLLLLGQFSLPPAELYYELPSELGAAMLIWAWLVICLVGFVLLPLLRCDRVARFWCAGMLLCLLPAAGPDANNRQLIFVSLGAMGLLAQAWHYYAHNALQKARRACAALFVAFRLVVSPLLLPLTSVSIALVSPMNSAAAAFAREPVAGRDVVFVSAPYSYVVRIVQIGLRLAGGPLPRHIRFMSAGSKPTSVERTGPASLELTFPDGLFSNRELRPDRSRRLAMPPGTTVQLEGYRVEVLEAAPNAGPTRARFTFEKPLDDPSLAFYRWDERRFVPFVPPASGQRVVVPGAVLPVGFE